MAKHLLKFNTAAEYSAATINKPAVSWVVEDNEVKYDPYVPPYVEIGGVKWAKMNIGAESETDTGLYFQWGDISGYTASQVGSGEGQKYFSWADYKYNPSGDGSTMTKYNSNDGKKVLDASDDAATANLGSGWRMPTEAEFQALGAAVNTAWTSNYNSTGVAGLVCTDKTDSSKVLFFPAAGLCNNGSVIYGSNAYYWSSSLFTTVVIFGRGIHFSGGGAYWQNNDSRYSGFTVRPVHV